MRRAADFICDNFRRNLKLAEIAAVVHMSEYHFAYRFKRITGVAPHQFLIARRTEHAQSLLRTTALSVGEVAHSVGFSSQSQFTAHFKSVGFSSQSQFTAHFKKVVGATPKVYRSGC